MNNSINWLGNRVVDSDTSYLVPNTLMNQYHTSGGKDAEAIPTVSRYMDPPSGLSQPTQPSQPSQPPQTPASLLPSPIQGPPPSTDAGFIPNYLAQNIGRNVRAEFIIGNDQYADKTGKLIEVGINYFVLEDVNSRTHVMCDLYSVKFVTVLQDNTGVLPQ